MATVESSARPPASAVQDRLVQPVFSSVRGRREHVVRNVGRLAAVLAGIWLVALLVGAMGLGSLPLIPGSGLLDPAPKTAKTPRARPVVGGARQTNFAARPMTTAGRGTPSQAGSRAGARHRTPARPAHPAPVAPRTSPVSRVAPPAAAPPLASPGRPQGRAVRRQGTQAQPAPPPPANQDAKGQAVENPGRLKHELLPPPPPSQKP